MTVLQFTPPKKPPDPTTIKMMNASSDIDSIILEAIGAGLSPAEVCALLTHRLANAILAAEHTDKVPLLDNMVDLLLEIHDNGGMVKG